MDPFPYISHKGASIPNFQTLGLGETFEIQFFGGINLKMTFVICFLFLLSRLYMDDFLSPTCFLNFSTNPKTKGKNESVKENTTSKFFIPVGAIYAISLLTLTLIISLLEPEDFYQPLQPTKIC